MLFTLHHLIGLLQETKAQLLEVTVHNVIFSVDSDIGLFVLRNQFQLQGMASMK